jgi:hypothetical protein
VYGADVAVWSHVPFEKNCTFVIDPLDELAVAARVMVAGVVYVSALGAVSVTIGGARTATVSDGAPVHPP